jgi:hypothetical protein
VDNNAPGWFEAAVLRLYALYPNTQVAKLTVPSWWSHIGHHERDVLAKALMDAPKHSPQFCPTAEMVRELADANAKGKKTTQRGDLTRAALSPPPEEAVKKLSAEEEKKAKEFFAQMRAKLGLPEEGEVGA